MGKIFLSAILCLGLITQVQADALYMQKFNTYQTWAANLPGSNPPAAFLTFINAPGPLATKLREKWLYQRAWNKEWQLFNQHYQPSTDINLRCYHLIGRYNLGQKNEAFQPTKEIWLQGESLTTSCSQLATIFLKSPGFNEELIDKRIHLALEKQNASLSLYLLTLYKMPRRAQAKDLLMVHQSPQHVLNLEPSKLRNDIMLYGLKREVRQNMKKAITLWHDKKIQTALTTQEKQAFLNYLVLYKAMRNQDDTAHWFAQIKPAFYNETLMEWQIRFALKHEHWGQVVQLINQYKNKNEPCWLYWRARALSHLGQVEAANAIYQSLVPVRSYYGFLASAELHKPLSFQNEPASASTTLLAPYQTFMNTIKRLYINKQSLQASRLLNDFILELPKQEASALIYWLDNSLAWYGKSVYLSNNAILANQLRLRFPLAYQDLIKKLSKTYAIHPAFIYAVIRQESGFREDVVSSAGARGLMQLMPNTAKLVAKQNKIAYSHPNELFNFLKNIRLGVAYLRQLSKKYTNNPLLMAAAYNAGPHQVNYWLKHNDNNAMDIWIETIPWQETRNYLKNIVAFYAVYQYRLQQKPGLGDIMKDLKTV